MTNVEKIIGNLKVGQLFESAKQKCIISEITNEHVVITMLKVNINPVGERILKSASGEIIAQPKIDNTPVLSDSTRKFPIETFAMLVKNKTFGETRIARRESYHDLKNLELNRFLVKQPLKL